MPVERLGRAATLAFGAAAMTTVAACSSPAPTPGNDAASGEDAAAVADASTDTDAGDDAGHDAASPVDVGVDTGTPVAAYGGPMLDAGNEPDSGGVAPLYGGAGT